METADDMQTIVDREKFCLPCSVLDDAGREKTRKEVARSCKANEKKEFGKNNTFKRDISRKKITKGKARKKKKFSIFKCGSEACGYETSYMPFNHKCSSCGSAVSFNRYAKGSSTGDVYKELNI